MGASDTVISSSSKRRRKTRPVLGTRCCSIQQQRLLVPLLMLLILVVVTVVLLVLSSSSSSSSWSHQHNISFSNSLLPLGQKTQSSSKSPLQMNTTSSSSSSSSSSSLLPIPSSSSILSKNVNAAETTKKLRQSAAMAPTKPLLLELELELELGSPYHNWQLFAADFKEMLRELKIYVYPHVSMKHSSSPFASIFVTHPDPFNPKLGNYFSEHMFKIALLRSSLLTSNPEHAHFFFMPFSINSLRNHPLVHSEPSIADFVAQYTIRISREYGFWNASRGSDHFYVCCHSVGRNAASKHHDLHNNAIQVACSSSYFQRLYIAHKDVGLPQVWPRPPEKLLNPPDSISRSRLVFFAGRAQNSQVRQELIDRWENDTFMDIFSQSPPFPYEEGFRRSKYCIHVKGYEVNTARISDAMHYGCIPVIISNHYDLPFANVLDWSKFSIIISHGDVALLKQILMSISRQMYLSMYHHLCQVRRHFKWHTTPRGYDSFYMTAYQLWVRRGMHLLD